MAVNFKGLSVGELLSMRSEIDKTLHSRRSELESQLAQIGGGGNGARATRSNKGRKVAAKYRNPKTGETWSGRGGVASWLAAEIKAGKKREDFLISPENAPKAGRGRPRKAGRKAA